MIIYGSKLCPDCVRCLEDMDRRGVSYEYKDFATDLLALKEFLAIRDRDPQFDEIRRAGKIGIPCILEDDGTVRLEW